MKKRYGDLTKQFPRLPSWAILTREFNVEFSESDNFPLKRILQEMVEYVRGIKSMVRPAIEPDASSAMGMYEHASLSPEELLAAFSLYKQLCLIQRTLQAAQVSVDVKDHVSAIADVTSEWVATRKQAHAFVELLRDAWINERPRPSKGPSYLG